MVDLVWFDSNEYELVIHVCLRPIVGLAYILQTLVL